MIIELSGKRKGKFKPIREFLTCSHEYLVASILPGIDKCQTFDSTRADTAEAALQLFLDFYSDDVESGHIEMWDIKILHTVRTQCVAEYIEEPPYDI